MTQRVVEIHVPLVESNVPEGEYAYPWIEKIEALIDSLDEEGIIDYFDDGEEADGSYIFFITGGADEQALLQAANRIATTEGVPAGVVAFVSSNDVEEWGQGRRVPLPLQG